MCWCLVASRCRPWPCLCISPRCGALLPAAYVVALSNLGIVVAAFLSVFVFREREHAAQRLIWASLLAASLLRIAIQV